MYGENFFKAPVNFVFHCYEEFKTVHTSTSFSDFQDWFEMERTKPLPTNKILASLFEIEKVFSKSHSIVSKNFTKDLNRLYTKGFVKSLTNQIEDVEGLGDFHNGKHTAKVCLNDKEKIIFKPTNSHVTSSFFELLDWINKKSKFQQGKFKILEVEGYQWLEFIEYNSCLTESEIREYYHKAGTLVCVLYLLNGTDFHYENLIANGNTPILIDHETIIQPRVSSSFSIFFKHFEAFTDDSVMKSYMLPEKNKINPGNCGLGYHKQTQYTSLIKKSVHSYSDEWKMETQFITEDLFKQNIPMLKGERVYPHQYLNTLIDGFESCYKLFMDNKAFLQSPSSPIYTFKKTKVRFIWRPTNVYAKIQNKMRLSQKIRDVEEYEQKIMNYLSVAFKNTPLDSDLRLILRHETSQMLRGDIPYFEIDTSSRNLYTEHGIIKDFFEMNCIENVERKLNKLSEKDLEHQKNLIRESFLN